MAVDPATLRIAAKAATAVITDEDTRKKLVMIFLVPIVSLIFIVSLFYYILTMPKIYAIYARTGSKTDTTLCR